MSNSKILIFYCTLLKNQIPSLEQEFLIYMESFASKLTELKNVPSIINRASSEVPSMGNLSLSDSFQGRQNAAKRKVKAKLETVMEDLISLSKKACEVQDWSAASDLVVGRAMKENEKLRKEYTRINNVRRDIDELMRYLQQWHIWTIFRANRPLRL